jgi:hypothetical protein
MRSALAFSLVCLASLSTACAAKKPPPPVAPTSIVSGELKAALERAKACTFQDGVPDANCEGFKAWEADTELANAQLLELIANEDVNTRALVVGKLSVQLTNENVDPQTLTTYLNAAEKEKVDAIAKKFAAGIAHIDLGNFGMLDRGIAIAKAQPAKEYQETYANGLRSSSEPDKVLAYAGELSKSENLALRNASLRMYLNARKERAEAACTGIDALRADKDSTLSQNATQEIGRSTQCIAQYDGILTAFEAMKLPKNPDAAAQYVGATVEGICQNKDKSQAQRDRSLALAKQISETKEIKADVRGTTLSAVLACDPKAGPTFVKKFTKDKDPTIAERAKKLLEPAAPPAPATPPAKGK